MSPPDPIDTAIIAAMQAQPGEPHRVIVAVVDCIRESGDGEALLRRAMRDWPDQCAAVQAMAVELGVSLGEAWRRVIAAGVDRLREGGDGEVRA